MAVNYATCRKLRAYSEPSLHRRVLRHPLSSADYLPKLVDVHWLERNSLDENRPSGRWVSAVDSFNSSENCSSSPPLRHGRCAYIYRNETQRSSQMGDYSQLRTFFLTCFHSYASICATFKVRPAPLASDKRQEIALLSTCEAFSFEYCRRSLIASLISFVD